MKWNSRILLLALLPALLATGCASTQKTETGREIARVQSETTPYDHIKTKLEMDGSRTFLAFMQEDVFPSMKTYMPVLNELASRYPNQYNKWQEELLEQGDGVAVRIDEKNYFFNLGYRDGKDRENDPKSGRSYGIGPTKKQSDPSYPYYLRELEAYLKDEPGNMREFFEALLLAVVKNDPSGWSKLSVKGQIVATDYLAIYCAESARHIMVNLHPSIHPWEIDLSAVTFVAPFVVKTGKMMSEGGQLITGDVGEFNGQGTNGSGVGITRKERKKLTQFIAKAVGKSPAGKQAIQTIESIIGNQRDDDVIQGLFEFLNSSKAPKKIERADQLIEAMLAYMDSYIQESENIR